MQWQGKSTNLSSNQVRGTVNLTFQYIMKQRKLNLWTPAKSYENLEHHFKSLQYNNNRVDNLKKLKTETKKSIEEKYKNVIKRLITEINDKEKRLADISTLTGVSNWLTVLPVTEFGFELSKQQFSDLTELR